jgi:hypothetical protein
MKRRIVEGGRLLMVMRRDRCIGEEGAAGWIVNGGTV